MKNEVKAILEAVEAGKMTAEEALLKIKDRPFEELGYAKVDTHRAVRQGVAEVIYGACKTPAEITGIVRSLRKNGEARILITRMSPEAADVIGKEFPLSYHEASRFGLVGEPCEPDGAGEILVLTGGTGDIPVAEEAALTCEALGNRVRRIYDVGVSGIHRLLSYREEIMKATVIIAVAGMEGALPSVVGGLSDCPVIAVPTSVGYGASFGGVTALLSMMNSCASGVSAVNIDNGFGAGYVAHLINHTDGRK